MSKYNVNITSYIMALLYPIQQTTTKMYLSGILIFNPFSVFHSSPNLCFESKSPSSANCT